MKLRSLSAFFFVRHRPAANLAHGERHVGDYGKVGGQSGSHGADVTRGGQGCEGLPRFALRTRDLQARNWRAGSEDLMFAQE